MLNRIRRAASLTRERYFPKGRHRRPLTPSRPLATPTSTTSADVSTVRLGPASAGAVHRRPLRGEDVELVRPYLVAWEERVRTRAVVVAPRLPADAWSALTGAR
ncbi:hypothetical protein GCM10010392_49840 [Streptomyces clavifer]|uniref:Uncharacterized protein n=1 Tax=Streptomyces clavifer TaxID=68188 RepID=A0ABS4V7U8_9ACTN|nr:hypothetical protein [Streptomyces clavifer]GHB15733.1 hypothetical protein GCM10010392_49840 [Streptomyces clavifer]